MKIDIKARTNFSICLKKEQKSDRIISEIPESWKEKYRRNQEEMKWNNLAIVEESEQSVI